MNVNFPRDLQRKFEQAIRDDAYTARKIFTCDELASAFEVSTMVSIVLVVVLAVVLPEVVVAAEAHAPNNSVTRTMIDRRVFFIFFSFV